jgi:hypothetical protein
MTDNNPLKQYFRRPALYLKLPSGGHGYPTGAIDLPDNGELPVYPMTAIDEITSRTPDALYNGTAVVEIIRSCIPSIKDPWAVTSIDLDPLLVAIKIATNGNKMEVDTNCPKCNEDSKYDLDLSRILAGFKSADYATPLRIGDLLIKFRPLSYTELNAVNESQFQAQRMIIELTAIMDEKERNHKSSQALIAMNEIAIDVMSKVIESITTPTAVVNDRNFVLDFLRNCDARTFDTIKDKNVELRQASETKPLHFSCPHCSNEYDQPFTVNMTNFFD